MRSLLSQIRSMLENRDDIELLEGPTDTIQGVQLRRAWELKVLNADGFSPVEKQQWHYYAQGFLIQEPRENKKGELQHEQRQMASKFWRLSCIVIYPKSIDDVINHLGPVPENFPDYLARKLK